MLNSIDKKDNKKIKIKQYTINNACESIFNNIQRLKEISWFVKIGTTFNWIK